MTRHALLADRLDFSADPGWRAADDAHVHLPPLEAIASHGESA